MFRMHNHALVVPKRRIMFVFAERILATTEAIMHDWIYSAGVVHVGRWSPSQSDQLHRVRAHPARNPTEHPRKG